MDALQKHLEKHGVAHVSKVLSRLVADFLESQTHILGGTVRADPELSLIKLLTTQHLLVLANEISKELLVVLWHV